MSDPRKRGPKRNPAQIDHDHRIIAERYLRGERQADIAVTLGISRQQVGYDMKVIREQWVKESLLDFNAAKARELAKVDRLELEAWRAWECAELRETESNETRKRRDRGKHSASESAEARKQIIRLKARDPRYLQIVGDCIDRRRKILGIDAPTKIAPTNPAGDAPASGAVVLYLPDNGRTESGAAAPNAIGGACV